MVSLGASIEDRNFFRRSRSDFPEPKLGAEVPSPRSATRGNDYVCIDAKLMREKVSGDTDPRLWLASFEARRQL